MCGPAPGSTLLTHMDKKARRRECLARIKSLGYRDRQSFSLSICELISASPSFEKAKTVFAYSALPEEPDLTGLIASHPEKNWAFPKITEGGQLSFFVARSMIGMIPGQFGIQEPHPDLHQAASFSTVDLILVPGLSFDPTTGARLGRGKGYYDKFLGSHCGSLTEDSCPLVVGVCFFLQLTTLQPEPHDFPMHQVVTERGWHPPA